LHWKASRPNWGQSRGAWSEGINLYAQSKRKQQLAVLKIESRSARHLVVPDYKIQSIETPGSQPPIPQKLQSSDQPPDRDSSSLLITQAALPAEPLVLNPVTQNLTLANQEQMTADSSQQHVSSDQQTSVRKNAVNRINEEIKPLKSRPPNYPWKARRKGIEGFVALEFSIDSNGRVANVEVLHSVPKGVFEKAASKALSRWTFAEPTESGSRFRQVFDFEMQEIEKVSPRKRPCVSTGTRTCGQISPGIYVVWINSATRSVESTAFN
jgi:TonB family protein